MQHADINHLFSHNTRVLTVNEVSMAVRCSPSHILELIPATNCPASTSEDNTGCSNRTLSAALPQKRRSPRTDRVGLIAPTI